MWHQILCVGIFAQLSKFIHFAYIDLIYSVLVCLFVTTLYTGAMDEKGNTPFHIHHAVEFGLHICERSAGSSPMVVTGVC